MRLLARRIRGALGIGVTWGALWVVIGLVVFTAFAIFDPEDIDPGEGLARVLPIFGLVGFLSGLGFAVWLSLAERRRTLHQLPLWRVGLWGCSAGSPSPC